MQDHTTKLEHDDLTIERTSVRPRSRALVLFLTVLLVFVTAVWLFDRFFLDDIITSVAARKLEHGVSTGSGGMFAIKVKHFVYRDGIAWAYGVDLERTGYNSNEKGITLGRVTADSLQISGIGWLDVVLKHPIAAHGVRIWQPTVFLTKASSHRSSQRSTTNEGSSSPTTFSVDSALLLNARMVPPGVALSNRAEVSLANYIRISGLSYNSAANGSDKFKTKRISFDIERFGYPAGSAWLSFQHALGDTQDSTITVDSFSYRPSRFRKRHSSTTYSIGIARVRATGLNYHSVLSGSAISMRSLSAGSWSVRSDSKGAPRPSKGISLWSQAALAKSIHIPMSIEAITLPQGSFELRKQSRPTFQTTDIFIKATNFHLTSHSVRDTRPLFCDDVTIRTPEIRPTLSKDRELIVSGLNASTRAGQIQAARIYYSDSGSTLDSHGLAMSDVDFSALCLGKRIAIGTLLTADWKVHWERAAREPTQSTDTTRRSLLDAILFPVSISHLTLPNGSFSIHKNRTATDTTATTWTFDDGERVEANGIDFAPKRSDRLKVAGLTAHLPSVHYDGSSAWYAFNLWNINASLQDSSMSIDSITYVPKYSKKDWALENPFARYRLDLRTDRITGAGIDFPALAYQKECNIRQVRIGGWNLEAYKDERPPKNPHPDTVRMPNDILARIQFPLTVNAIDIASGNVQIQTIPANGAGPANLSFDSVWMSGGTFTLDSASDHAHDTTSFTLSGVFVKQSRLAVSAKYALKDTSFDLSLLGHVGAFDAERLNDYLVPEVREQIRKGHLDSGIIAMRVSHGVSETTVTPVYHDLHVNVLPKDPHDKPDLKEDIQSLIANEFIVHDDNPDHPSKQPRSATARRVRKPTDAFFQFIWSSIKQPLGQIVGGIK